VKRESDLSVIRKGAALKLEMQGPLGGEAKDAVEEILGHLENASGISEEMPRGLRGVLKAELLAVFSGKRRLLLNVVVQECLEVEGLLRDGQGSGGVLLQLVHIPGDLGERVGCAVDAGDPRELLRAQVRLAQQLGAMGQKFDGRWEVSMQGGEQVPAGARVGLGVARRGRE
jgi:hypothetical protein